MAEARADKGEPAPMGADRVVGGGLGSFGGSLPLLAFGALGGAGAAREGAGSSRAWVSFKAASPQDLALPSLRRD